MDIGDPFEKGLESMAELFELMINAMYPQVFCVWCFTMNQMLGLNG